MRALPMAGKQVSESRQRDWPWPVLRALCLAAAACVIALCFMNPGLGSRIFWGGLMAYLPLLLLIAPGVWRNACPMATMNGLAGRLGWAGTRRLSAAAQRRTPYIAVGLFFALTPLRAAGLDQDGHLLAVFLLLLLATAAVGGVAIAGKGGWCSQICPMLPVERLYGLSPLVVVQDTHCRPCVGCARNCYDLQPTASGLADLRNKSNPGSRARLLFAAAMPWFCLAFFTQPHPHHLTVVGLLAVYGRLGLITASGATLGVVIDALGPWSRYQVVVVHAAVVINTYYLFVVQSPVAVPAIPGFWTGLAAYMIPVIVSLVWLQRALVLEQLSVSRGASGRSRKPHGGPSLVASATTLAS